MLRKEEYCYGTSLAVDIEQDYEFSTIMLGNNEMGKVIEQNYI